MILMRLACSAVLLLLLSIFSTDFIVAFTAFLEEEDEYEIAVEEPADEGGPQSLLKKEVVEVVFESLFFTVQRPDKLKYLYELSPSYAIGVDFPRKEIQGINMYYADPPEACQPLQNWLLVQGEVVLIERGGCSFIEKVLNAEKAGAAIAIVTDSANGTDGFINMVADESRRRANIPVAYLPGVSGRRFRQYLTYEGESIVLNIPVNMTMKSFTEVIKKPPWELW